MTNSTKSHHWFQFSIASLLWLMTVASTASYGVRERLERIRLQDELSERDRNSVTIGLSAPGVFTADLDIPFSQDSWTTRPAQSKP